MSDRFLVTIDGGIRLSTSTMKIIVPIVAGHLRARRTVYCRALTDLTLVAALKLDDGTVTVDVTRHGGTANPPEWVDTLVDRLNQERLT